MDINDILNNDPFGLLDISEEDLSIFDTKHIDKIKKVMPEYLARAKPVESFGKYEDIFSNIHKHLKNKTMIQKTYCSDIEIKTQTVFVVGGVVGMVIDEKLSHETDKVENQRVHVVLENGTESFLKLRSLQSALYKNGKIII